MNFEKVAKLLRELARLHNTSMSQLIEELILAKAKKEGVYAKDI